MAARSEAQDFVPADCAAVEHNQGTDIRKAEKFISFSVTTSLEMTLDSGLLGSFFSETVSISLCGLSKLSSLQSVHRKHCSKTEKQADRGTLSRGKL